MLLDTSGLMCLFDKRKTRHPHAIEHYNSAHRRLTHNYVLAEFVALAISRRAPRSEALQFVEALVTSSEVEVIWVDKDLHQRSVQFLKQRQDKSWSLCDAVSFVTMQEHLIIEALTTDRDFEQAGLVKLLD